MKSAFFPCGFLLVAALAAAQDTSPHPVFPAPGRSGQGRVSFAASNVQLLGWKTHADFPGGNVTGNDCWGHTSASGREYAILGLSNGTAFVEITDPGRPEVVGFVSGPPNLWRGVKTYAAHAYAVSEGGGGIQVFDLAGLDGGEVSLVNTVQVGGLTTATHTLAIDETSGFLYRAGGGQAQGLVIYDLADPDNPTLAGQWHTNYVHECQVVPWDLAGPYFGREIAFCYMGDLGQLRLLDVTVKSAITEIATFAYPGAVYAHQGWLAADKQTLYLDDEYDEYTFGGARTRIIDVSDLSAPSYVGFFASAPSSDHNLYVRGNRIYESNFCGGLRIFDATNPIAPVEVGFFDTYPDNDGWRLNSLGYNYPYFASGTILGSDIEKGMFLWREGPARIVFEFVGGEPDLVDPLGATLTFDVHEDLPGDLVPGSVTLHHSAGAGFTSVAATSLGHGRYSAALPAEACGTELALYLSARSSDGTTWTEPPAAPTQVHLARAAYVRTLLFENTLEGGVGGWLAGLPGDTASTGQWTHVNPVGTDAQPEDDHTADGSRCFVTGQGAPDGPAGDSDVDGGFTTLRSPLFDASGFGDPHLVYWRWFSNFQRLLAVDDTFVVELSNDGGASWVGLELIEPGSPDALGGWIRHEARLADFLASTSTMCLRFIAQDLGAGSTVEAAIDDLQLLDYDCTPVTLAAVAPARGAFQGGDLVTLTGSGFVPDFTRVRFGDRDAGVVAVQSSTHLTVRTPPAPRARADRLGRLERRVDVVVTNPGSATLPGGFTYRLERE